MLPALALLLLSTPLYSSLTRQHVFTAINSPPPSRVRYDHQQIVSVPATPTLFQLAESLDLDVWSRTPSELQLRVTPAQKWQLQHFTRNSVNLTVLVEDIQPALDAELAQLSAQPAFAAFTNETWHKAYHPFDDVANWLVQINATYAPVVTLVPSIGKTAQGRDIPMLRITGTNKAKQDKKAVWIQGLQHAREWISASSMQYIAHYLPHKYANGDARVVDLLDKVEIYLVVICNPDGYEYTWKRDRLWRKNRSGVAGVDINRNWPDHWAQGGSSSFPGSDTYHGPSAGSELEIQALMREYTRASFSSDLVLAVDFHAFSQLVLRPYGWTEKRCEDESDFVTLGEVIKKAMAKRAGTKYVSERVIDLYKATGGSNDWWYGMGTPKGQRKPYGIAIELPPASAWGADGFILPPERIIPIGEEVLEAVVSMCEYAIKNPLDIKQ